MKTYGAVDIWTRVLSFTFRPLYPRYLSDRGLTEHQNRPQRRAVVKTIDLTGAVL
jgi:hypothetical protein